MKKFQSLKFDAEICYAELEEFRQLLISHKELSERKDILPFFRKRQHLAALIGAYHTNIIESDLIAYEYPLFGDFVVDLAVGNSKKNAYCFIEFEDGKSDSIFVNVGRTTLEWSPRFEHGFSQIVDWFWKLSDFEKTDEFENMFGDRSIDFIGILVIGRSQSLGKKEERRLRWRKQKVLVNSQHIHCVTFDELLIDLSFCLERYRNVARIEDAN